MELHKGHKSFLRDKKMRYVEDVHACMQRTKRSNVTLFFTTSFGLRNLNHAPLWFFYDQIFQIHQ